ncbi:rabaptin-like protein domain-containing protein [Phthorimaea operculella]|nr:rabaptin-like protein domain-containing protein [Phthorimaea operculella]
MEITALKNKLRETDAQLQEALKEKAQRNQANVPGGDSKPGAEATRQCDMCLNYEKQLVSEQTAAETAREKAKKLDTALKMATEELEGVRSIHDETIRSWHTERAASQQQLEALKTAVELAKTTLEEKANEAQEASQRALEQVTTLTVQRETLQKKLNTLERDNQILIGEFGKKAEEMQNEKIDLPDNVAELQEMNLYLREQLIESAIGRERALEGEQELRNQLLQQGALFHKQDEQLSYYKNQLKETNPLSSGNTNRVRYRAREGAGRRARVEEPAAPAGGAVPQTRRAAQLLQEPAQRDQFNEQLIESAIGRERALEGEQELRNQLLQQGALFHKQDEQLSYYNNQLKETKSNFVFIFRPIFLGPIESAIGRERALEGEQELRNQLLQQGALFHKQDEQLSYYKNQLKAKSAIGRERALEGEQELRNQLLQQGALFHKQDEQLSYYKNQLKETNERTKCENTNESAIGRERALEGEQELRNQLLQQGALFHKQDEQLSYYKNQLKETK